MKKVLCRLSLVIVTVIIFVILVIAVIALSGIVLLPSDYLFYEHSPACSFLMAPLLVAPSFIATYCAVYYLGKKLFSLQDDFLGIVELVKKLGKWMIPIVVLWLVLVYSVFTNLTYVTKDSIVVLSPLNLKGTVYKYSDVEKIETGFGSKKFSFYEHEKAGNFYYKITVDGRKIVFHMPTVNDDIKRYDDSYLELEEFDSCLSKYGIVKESDPTGYEKCDFDKVYVDRFLRIINS